MSESSTRKLVILVRNDDYCRPDMLERISVIAPAARVITADEYRRDPSLIEQAEVVLGRLERETYARAGRLRWMQITFAGMDWAHYREIREHPAVVTNARIHAVPIAEHMFGLLLMLIRQLHQAVLQQSRRSWACPAVESIDTLAGKTLCILGLGTIGRQLAHLGRAHGMRVIAVRRNPAPAEGVERIYGPDELHAAMKHADVVMNILPLTSATRHIIGQAEFEAMPDGCYFLNAGRGATVDTGAIVQALKQGKPRGAGLDVVDPEPLPPDHPLWGLPNVIITSHCSGLFAGYMEKVKDVFIENLRRYAKGEPLMFVVDKEAGY